MKQKILSTQNKRKDSHTGSVFGQYKEILLSKLDKETTKQNGGVDIRIQELIEQSIEKIKGIKQHNFTIDDLFSDSTWQCEFHQQYLCQLQNHHSQQFNLLILSLMIADGYFDQKLENQQTQVIQQAAPRPLSNLFILKCNEIGLSILFEVGIHKNHIIEGYEQLIGFEINHKITFIDIRNDSQQSQLVNAAQQYVKQTQRNPYRSDLPLITQEQVIIPQIKQSAYLDSLLYKFQEQNWGSLVFGEPGKVKRWIPYEFPKFKLKQCQIAKFQWEDNKFISKDWINIKTMNKNFIKCNQINKALFQRYADFKSASKIIDFLHTHTQFKTKLSIQERVLLEETGNIMVIGRSGTGKTTCAILRLFSMQLLLKYRVKITGQKIKLFKHSQNENKNISLHCLFTAQNQMLVDEVKQQYRKFLLELKPQNVDRSITQTETESESDFDNLNRSELQNLLFNQDQQLDQQIELEDIQVDRQRELQQQSLRQFNDSDFPIFLSIKELILLFDNCLNQPYLQNERFLVEENQNDHAGWQVGETHQVKIYLDDGRFKIVRIIEVDYQYFKTIFWPTIQNQLKKQQNNESYKNLIWTQIYSYIKGSEYSHQYLDQGLPFQVFYNNFNQMLTFQQAQEIYDIYLSYEKWKDKQGIFDRMDIVNYQINCVERFQFNSNPIHYTMIDEIQDLPHATIKLISKITEQNLYCSGDTAQNIQKGVGFRFQDLRSLLVSDDKFSDIVNEKVKLHQLTINFRSHDQILKLANNVVSLIETLFPKTIDKLKKELSEKQGPKPFIVKSNNFQTLIQLLRPQNLQNQNQQQIEQINLMGAEKVIIVRSNNDKKKINQIIDNILVLTVHEAKGLEFNDVILFNFFMEEEIQLEQWQLLSHLKFDNGKMQLDPKFNYQQYNYGPLCLELKQLYVCLTRAKYRIIIFDEFTNKRQIIENIWYSQELVQDFQEENLYSNQIQPELRDKQLEELQRQGWREKGKKLFDVKNYNEAMKCFRFSGDINLENQCKAFHIATHTQQELNTITAKFKSKGTFPKTEQDKIALEYKRIQTRSIEEFRFAANIFQKINCHIQAAQCFYSGQMYEQATIEYLIDNQYLGAADSSFEGQLYQLAGLLYLKSNYFEKSIIAFEKVQDYFVILLILYKNKTYYITDEFQFKLHKYIPLFLEQVFDKFNNHRFDVDFKQIYKYLSHKRNELQNEIDLIECIIYPKNEDELIDCIWHTLRLNSHFIVKKLEISIMNYDFQTAQILFETNYIDEFNINHKILITDIIGYYGLYDLLDFLNIKFQLISKEAQINMFYQVIFKYSQQLECNTRQKIQDSKDKNFGSYYKKFIQSQELKEQKQYFGILYLFGFQEQMHNFLNELRDMRLKEYKQLSELFEFKIFKVPLLEINQVITYIEQYMKNWNRQNCVIGFYQIIVTIFELFNNKNDQDSFVRKINNHGFQQIVLFLSFTANILKYNQYLNVQLQLFEALCVYYNLIVPHNKCMQFISQSYIIISKRSKLFSKHIETESLNIGEEIFLAPTNLIVKQIRKIFQSLIKDFIKLFFKDEHNKIQVEQRLYQQFFQTKHKKYFKDYIIFNPISQFQVDFIFYLEKAFRLKFDQNLESIKLDNNYYLEDRFLNLISYQYLIKAVLNIDYESKIERVIKGLQLSSYQQADIALEDYFKTFLYLNESLNKKFNNQDIDDIDNYQIALKYGKQPYFDFNYLDYLLFSYQNNSIKKSLKRDFRISFIYILNLVIILQKVDEKNDNDQIIDVTYKVDKLLHDNLIQKILDLSKKQEQHGQRYILVKKELNSNELMSILTNWLKWYFSNFGILGNKYAFLLFDNCNLKMKNILIENIEQSQSLSKQEKDKLLIEGKSENADETKDYIYKIKYGKFNPPQEKLNPEIQRFSLQQAYFSTKIYEIRSASTVLTSTQFDQQIKQINQNIYYDQFNKCYNQVEMMRKKILIYIFKICNNPIKFRSAMKLLMDLKYSLEILYQNLEDDQNNINDFDDRGLFQQLQYVDKQITQWQLKNDKFKAQINQLQNQNDSDISNIKLQRKIDINYFIKNNY